MQRSVLGVVVVEVAAAAAAVEERKPAAARNLELGPELHPHSVPLYPTLLEQLHSALTPTVLEHLHSAVPHCTRIRIYCATLGNLLHTCNMHLTTTFCLCIYLANVAS